MAFNDKIRAPEFCFVSNTDGGMLYRIANGGVAAQVVGYVP